MSHSIRIVDFVDVPEQLRARIDEWENLSRWDRSEVGRDLRRLGLSYGEIQRYIEVKKSTLATWCRDITLTEEQKAAIQKRTGSQKGIPRNTNWRRRLEVEKIRERARNGAPQRLSDPFWVAGVVLYWAEGSKTARRLQLAHTEAPALRLFRSWARRYLNPNALFRASVNLHADNDEPAAREWWAQQLDLHPASDFTKTFVKPDGTGHRKNHLPYGTCRLTMRRSTDAWYITLAWIDVIRVCDFSYPSPLRAAGAIGSATDS